MARAEHPSLRRLPLQPDLGQVVPESLGGDIRLSSKRDKAYAEPVGKAEVYIVTKNLPETTPEEGRQLVVGAAFGVSPFSTARSSSTTTPALGTLKLTVGAGGEVSGALYSDRTAQARVAGGRHAESHDRVQRHLPHHPDVPGLDVHRRRPRHHRLGACSSARRVRAFAHGAAQSQGGLPRCRSCLRL